MPQKAWSAKRERQYLHIKAGLIDSGKPLPLAEEIAARVVNKEGYEPHEAQRSTPSQMGKNRC